MDAYYTACIPFYCEFLGEHWHTGWYAPGGPVGAQDQLRMEMKIAADAAVDVGCEVLDVGCGVGGPACHIAARTGARVLGVTPNAAQLALARAGASRRGLTGRVQFVQGSAHALPCADGSVDVVLFFESACHFPDRARFFSEVHRVLRPGGRLAGEDWLAVEAATLTQRPFLAALEAAWAIPRLGTLTEYAAAMTAVGMEVEAAVDLREEMALRRGFLAEAGQRAAVRRERAATADPVRAQIMRALEHLGEAVEAGLFTVGRFLARKPVTS